MLFLEICLINFWHFPKILSLSKQTHTHPKHRTIPSPFIFSAHIPAAIALNPNSVWFGVVLHFKSHGNRKLKTNSNALIHSIILIIIGIYQVRSKRKRMRKFRHTLLLLLLLVLLDYLFISSVECGERKIFPYLIIILIGIL